MIRFTCETVYDGWPDVANPDDIDAMLDLGQTKHKFYPALRELVLLYDAIADKREAVYTIGLGESMKVSAKNANDDLVEVNLGPVRFIAERDRILEPLGELLVEVFKAKDAMSTQEDRERGLEVIQSWIDKHDGQTDVHALYADLMSEAGE